MGAGTLPAGHACGGEGKAVGDGEKEEVVLTLREREGVPLDVIVPDIVESAGGAVALREREVVPLDVRVPDIVESAGGAVGESEEVAV
jgi:hypothetical protein